MEPLIGLLAVVFVALLFLRGPKRRRSPPDPLDAVVLHLTEHDDFTLRDLVKSCLCVGAPGSGKSSGSLPAIEGGALRNGCGGLILESKPEELDFHAKLFDVNGRSGDRVLFGPSHEARVNLLDSLKEQGADAKEYTRFFMNLGETVANQGSGADSSDPLWKSLKESHLEAMIEILLQGRGRLQIGDMTCFLDSAPYTVEDLKSDAWRAGFCNESFALANANKERSDTQKNDYDYSFSKWMRAFPRMPEKMRGSFVSDIQAVLHPLSTGITRDLIATKSNFKLSSLGEGKWLDVAMPPTRWGVSASVVCGGIKYLTQRMILGRDARPADPVILIIIDEYQQHITTFDADFLAQSRSHKGAMFCLIQSIHPIANAMKGRSGQSQAESLMTLYGTKLSHSLGDALSASWASGLCGDSLETFVGASEKPGQGIGDVLFGEAGITASFSTQYQPRMRPAVWLDGGLRCGGPRNNFIVDGVAIKNDQPYASSDNFVFFSFRQPGR